MKQGGRHSIDPRPTEARRCTAKAKSTGERCARWALAGAKTCRVHGSANKRSRDAAARATKRVATLEQVRGVLADLGHDPREDPYQGLSAELGTSAQVVRVLGDLVGKLEAIYGPNHLGDGAPHVVYTMWSEERDRHAKLAKMAIDVGIAEKQLGLAERQADLLASIFIRVLRDPAVGLAPHQQDIARKVVARELRRVRELEPGSVGN